MKKITLFCLLITIVFLAACKKVEDPTTNPSTFNAPNPAPTFSDADGVLAAITTLTYQSTAIGDFAVEADVATAAFFNTASTYYDGGAVSVNTNDLEKQDNNAYVSVSQTSTTVDLGFGSTGNDWSVAGGTDVPAFTHTTNRGMPSDIKFSSEAETINTANSYTVSIESAPSTTDSILYLMAAENKTVTKIVSSSTTSVTFSAADMSGLDGSGVVQVAAYNYQISAYGGKNMYFINEKVITDLVTFE